MSLEHGRWLRRGEAARHCAISKSYLEKLAVFGGGPAFSKVGRSCVYDCQELDRWLKSKEISSTSEATS